MRTIAILVAVLIGACEPEAAPPPAPSPEAPAVHLRLPSELLARARREASGLARMPDELRERTLREHAARIEYGALRAAIADHVGARVRFEGRVGLIAPAGERLWILAVMTRREGERWVDPLYVASVREPAVVRGANATVDGFVIGERTIGRHTLPLVLAFSLQ